MSNPVKESCEKCSFFIDRIKTNGKKLQCTHLQKRRSRRILEKKFKLRFVEKSNFTIINSKLQLKENSSSNSFTDENFNLCIKNSEPPIDDDDDVRSSTTISDLPHEMLCEIFSNLSFMDLYFNVSNVCRRWNTIARNPFEWRNLTVDGEMNSKLLLKLLSQAAPLQSLQVINRCDTNAILRKVIKFCPKIKYISLSNCRGNKSGHKVSFGSLMKAVTTHNTLRIMLKEGTGLSAPPPENSKIMKQYSVKYHMGQQNLITIYPVLRW